MKIEILTKYRKIRNTVNIFQLTGDARDGKKTMDDNIKRIVKFYYFAVPQLSSNEIKMLPKLLKKFYVTSTFYRAEDGFSEFIVPTFSVINNQEWITIDQFIAFLQNMAFSDRLNTVNKYSLQKLIEASQAIKSVYYDKHIHTMVSQKKFNEIINQVC